MHDGGAVATAPQRARHSLVKAHAIATLVEAVRRARAPCRVYAEGLAIAVKKDRLFRPDAVVACPGAAPDARTTATPLIALKVHSPSSAQVDRGRKLDSYFRLSSLAHDLIVDPDRRALTHFAPTPGGAVKPHLLHEGELRLDPPGLNLDVGDLFGPAE